MQESPDDPSHIQASACCKHFVANSLESSYGPQDTSWNRENDDAAVTMQDLVDSYMLPFQACVEQGRVSGLMCSCKCCALHSAGLTFRAVCTDNALNGVPTCANDWLLKDIARGQWGFDGYIT